jgi:hypothetical protein
MARRDGMRRLVLIFLHLASADGYDVRPVTFKSWWKFRPVSTGKLRRSCWTDRRPVDRILSLQETARRRVGSPLRRRDLSFEVEKQFTSWPEQDQRHTRWFELQEAADAVQEPELSAMILRLAALLA